jgi:hypothetical protein
MEIRKITRTVTLSGLTPIMFDRYSGNNKETLAVMEKVYVNKENHLVLPSVNIISFLSAQNTESATQRVVGRGYKEVCKSALSYVNIDPFYIPILRDNHVLLKNDENVKIHFSVAKIMKGKLAIPNPKERPIIDTPWEVKFKITLQETPELNENLLKRIFEIGGNAIGLGTFRGVFGKFQVTQWE